MKHPSLLRRAFVALALLSTPVWAAGTFEGRIDMKITTPSDQKTDTRIMHYAIKGDKLRLDFEGDAKSQKHGMNAAGMIIDFDKREMVTLIDSQDENGAPRKMAMRHAMSEPKQKPGSKTSSAKDVQEPVPTGRTETIAGYSASEYKVKDEDGATVELWLAKGLGNFMSPQMMNARSGEASPGWEKILREGGLFPLRIIAHDSDGEVVSRTEVTKIDKSSVPDSVFSTEGYSEFQRPAINGKSMLKGMLGR